MKALEIIPFNLKFMLVIIAFFALISGSCKKNNEGGVVAPTTAIDTTLYKAMPFPMGAALNVNLLRNNTKYNAVGRGYFKNLYMKCLLRN